ncbi:hypothetical protein EPO15_16705 [bacterium]|nr:MAG: hypothetical protein EPO15_16705 [bacterium]
MEGALGGIDGADWVVGRGTVASWRAVTSMRAATAEAELRRAAQWAGGVPSLAAYAPARSIEAVLSAPPAVRAALLLFPAMDCWLSYAPAIVAGARPEGEAFLHFAYFQSFAAAAAVLGGAPQTLKVRLSPDARFHATGTRWGLSFPKDCAGKDAVVKAARGKLSGTCGKASGKPTLLPALAEGMWVEQDDPLVLQPIVMHGLVRNDARAQARFVRVLSAAMARIQDVDRGLFDEMTDFLRLIVPLDNPKDYGSVSSSYKNMRGALCLSHSDDQLLQEETLIHEFCHQKANLLTAADPLLKPGQGGQIVYSPLRPDARRLWGLLLGAHAFVNVNRYLQRVLRREAFPDKARLSVQANIARRLCHVDDMLRTVSLYADLTPVGERFQSRLWREHAVTLHDALDFPPAVMEEGRARWLEHRAKKALAGTGVYAEEAK